MARLLRLALFLILTTGFFYFIFEMVFSYLKTPMFPEFKHGNIEGILFYYIPIIIIEYILMVLFLVKIAKIKYWLRLIFIVILIFGAFISTVLAMGGGSVEAIHAFWLYIIVGFCLLLSLIFKYKGQNI